jgi:hypothetical protein
VSGNEESDRMAKLGANDRTAGSPQSRLLTNVASAAYLKCRAAEKKRSEAVEWATPSIVASRDYKAPKTPRFRPELHRVRKELPSRYYQLMTGHTVIAPYLKYKIKTADSDECWWCEVPGKRQSREHLFKECLHWKEEIKELWRKVRRVTGWQNVR